MAFLRNLKEVALFFGAVILIIGAVIGLPFGLLHLLHHVLGLGMWITTGLYLLIFGSLIAGINTWTERGK